ncbi:TonB-dependent siderophore receptor [Pseudomonas mosselii]|uniref:TonB-dependent receptor n=2 Tax=Pseudomonas TaxID=286 RepID=A0ABX9AV83_9PSED|nr:TonB-dependent receptor [Pseudomonas mosselii]MBC3453319.1 TonB-dependent siderophore receptor [Pseudomonas mosselii]MDH1530088.1 TonB-dependent receptor [Pseudomonas mosselii]QZP24358.1 TonB-dependent receptor [Pseudomonas mosselii]
MPIPANTLTPLSKALMLRRMLRSSPAMATLGLALSLPLAAQVQAQEQDFDIPAQSLASALQELGRQGNLQVLFSPETVQGLRSSPVKGRFSPTQAAGELLRNSGIRYSVQDNTLIISGAAESGSAMTLDATTINGQVLGATTEGTNSYTTGAVTIGKTAQSLRETPQSVTVVTRKLMDDKNLVSLDQVMAQTTGITRANRGYGNHHFSSRGFDLTDDSYMVDGVPGQAYAYTGWMTPDMAVFDRVEVLRGASGLLVGAGNPGGAVNLVRKRPTADPRFSVTTRAGSWDNYRLDLDASGRLNPEGTLRGRMVASYEDRGYFTDVTKSKRPLLYGIVEADLSDATTVGLGLRRQTSRIDGYSVLGIPNNPDGSNPHLKRSTFLGQDWATLQTDMDEVFGDITHRFNDNWSGKLALSHSEGGYNRSAIEWSADDTLEYGAAGGPVVKDVSYHKFDVTSNAVDGHLDGTFEAFGLTHQVTLGANWSKRKMNDKDRTEYLPTPIPLNVFDPSHSNIPKLARQGWDYKDDTIDTRYGTYLSTRLRATEDLSFVLGARLSWYKTEAWDGDLVTTNEQKHEFTPFAGVIYDLNDQWSWYASYADIFQPQANYRTAAGSMLDPSTGTNSETGIKGELFDKRLNVSFAVFYIEQEDVAARDWENDGKCQNDVAGRCWVNSDGINRSKGFEAEASGELLPGLQVAAGYTYNTTSSSDGGPISAQTPKHMLRLNTNYTLPGEWSRLSIGGGVSAQNSYVDKGNEAYNSGRAIFDARAAYKLDEHWTVGVDVENLFDRKYFDSMGYWTRGTTYGTPRSYMFTLRGDF